MTVLLVALGGAIGAVLRWLLSERLGHGGRPGTLLANTVASGLLGACTGAALTGSTLAFVGTGICGALSTYSSLAVQVRDLGPRRGTAYALTTIALGLGACALGFVLAVRWFGQP